MIVPGVYHEGIDEVAEDYIRLKGARPAFKELGFSCVLCASINEEVVHGIPVNGD
jgi:methionyl aminopeptidase